MSSPVPMANPLPRPTPAAVACQKLAIAIGFGQVTVVLTSAAIPQIALGRPATILVPSRLAKTPGDSSFRFWIGRALALAVTPGALIEHLTNDDLEQIAQALTDTRTGDPAVEQLKKQVTRVLPRKVRKRLEHMTLPAHDGTAWEAYRLAEQQRADRVGMLFSRDAKLALTQLAMQDGLPLSDLARSPRLTELMQFVVSDDYTRLCRDLWATQTLG